MTTNPTTSRLIREWDEPEDGQELDEWPYPDHYAEYLIEGDLADKIRARAHEDAPVYFEELTISGGWSEWTQENDYSVTIRVGNFHREFSGDADLQHPYSSALPAIQEWLEGAE